MQHQAHFRTDFQHKIKRKSHPQSLGKKGERKKKVRRKDGAPPGVQGMDNLGSAEPREPRAVIPKKRLRRFIFLVLSEVPCVKLDSRIAEVNGESSGNESKKKKKTKAVEEEEEERREEEEEKGVKRKKKKLCAERSKGSALRLVILKRSGPATDRADATVCEREKERGARSERWW